MSEISLTLVLQIKTSRIINDMAKIQQKSEKISAFGGIFFVVLLDLVQINMLVTLIYPIKFVPLRHDKEHRRDTSLSASSTGERLAYIPLQFFAYE